MIAQSPESAAPPSPAGACYVEDRDCNDTPGFLPDPVGEAPAEPVQPDAGLIAPDAEVPGTIDPLA